MGARILICDPIAQEGIDRLKTQGFSVEIKTDLGSDGLEREISRYDAMVVRSATKVREKIIDSASNLKIIVRAGVGLDNIDVDYAEDKGIVVENTPEASSNAVAELAVGHMFALARRIPQGTSSLKRNKWIKSQLKGTELRDKTIGIIGIGRIGSLVAEKTMCLGMKPLAYDKFVAESFVSGVKMVEKDELLRDSDFVTLHIPFVESEGPTIGKAELSKMKETAFVINCARGGVVDEKALATALSRGWIAGAAIDVFVQEPPIDTSLTDFENVSLTPHLGASTEEAQKRVGQTAAEKLIRFFEEED